MKKLRIVILHNQINIEAKADEADVLQQVELINNCLQELGYEVHIVPLSLNLKKGKQELTAIQPQLVFNLVESFDNCGELVFLAPALLDSMRIPYTGTQTLAMLQSANKTLTKKNLIRAKIPTPASFNLEELYRCQPGITYILKPKWEEGSLGLDENAIFNTDDTAFMNELAGYPSTHFFIEAFIEGREFNCALVGTSSGPQVLAVSEIFFLNYPAGKPKILGYKAKWEVDSFEYKNTVRNFDFCADDNSLLEAIKLLSIKSWFACNLNGYARVDFRLDNAGNPFVLEVNANPCISPDSGFYAAAVTAGFRFTEIVQLIIDDALRIHHTLHT